MKDSVTPPISRVRVIGPLGRRLLSAMQCSVAAVVVLFAAPDVDAAALNVSPTVTPLSSAEIVNPMRGYIKWGGTETVPGVGPSVDSYTRLAWTDLEGDTAGSYNMQKIYDGIASAKATGGPKAKYSFGIRVMRSKDWPNTTLVPLYARNLMPKGFYNGTTYIPDWNDSDFTLRFKALLTRVAQEFDGHPDIGFFEMCVYGTYGEWVTPGVYPSPTGATGATTATLQGYVDMYVATFTQTRLVMMTDNEVGLVYAMGLTPTGGAPWMGWSRKSLGDPHFATGMTPAKLAAIADRWKKAPVFGEFFGGDRTNGTTALQQVRDFHVSVIGNGNLSNGNTHTGWGSYPATEQADFIKAGKEAGYRFSLTNLTIPETLYVGGTFTAEARWQNAGLNPLHEPFTIQYELRNGSTIVQRWDSALDLEDWTKVGATPTLHTDRFAVSSTVAAGSYSFVAIVTSLDGTRDPLKLAIGTARNADGSYTLGTVTINASPTLSVENFDDGDVTNPAWTTSVGPGGAVLYWVSQSTWSPPLGPDGSARYVKIEFNSAATYQYAVLNRGAATFGATWANAGANRLRFWFKGHASNVVSGSNRVRVQLRESDNGERWSFDLGNLATNATWQQVTVPFTSLYRLNGDGTQTPGGTANAFDLSLIDQVRFFDNSNGSPIAIYVDRLEVLRQ